MEIILTVPQIKQKENVERICENFDQRFSKVENYGQIKKDIKHCFSNPISQLDLNLSSRVPSGFDEIKEMEKFIRKREKGGSGSLSQMINGSLVRNGQVFQNVKQKLICF